MSVCARVPSARHIDLDGVVDDEVDGHKGVDLLRIPTQRLHRLSLSEQQIVSDFGRKEKNISRVTIAAKSTTAGTPLNAIQ